MTTTLRPNLTELPDRLKRLPVYRGYPVPWFVAMVEGLPEFRVADAGKRVQAVNYSLCWVCGQRLGTYLAFVVGPMCTLNRISSDPAMHRECAEWSVLNCPFLTRPHMERRENAMPEEAKTTTGFIGRNPGVTILWITKGFRTFVVDAQKREWLIKMGVPREVITYREGRLATKEELLTAIRSGYPLLHGQAKAEGPAAMAALQHGVRDAATYLQVDLSELLKDAA